MRTAAYCRFSSDAQREASTRGGAGKGQGRKPVKPGEETITASLRMTAGQRSKLELLGGAKWVREQIDAANIC